MCSKGVPVTETNRFIKTKSSKYSMEDEDSDKREVLIYILGTKLNIVNLGVGAVELAAIKLSNTTDFFSGLGSEEIFAGYQRPIG